MTSINLNNNNYNVWVNQKGYACITINECGHHKAYLLHRLIWELKFGPIPKGYELHHIDYDKSNWQPENLIMMDRQSHQTLHRQRKRSTDIYHKTGNDENAKTNPDMQ